MGCEPLFLREPDIRNLTAMGNDILVISRNEWQDQAHTLPLDLSAYTGRGALKNKNTGVVFGTPFTVVITNSVTPNVPTNVTATIAKPAIETLPLQEPFIYDISLDSTSPVDSFTLMTGIITFYPYAST